MKPQSVTIKIAKSSAGERADKMLTHFFGDISRSRLQEAFANGKVLLSGAAITKSHRLVADEVLVVELPEPPPTEINAVEGKLVILYEDEDLLVLDKGPALVMHPGSGTGEDTLVHFALHHTGGKLSKLGGVRRPGIVHRLDKDTTGALVLAKSDRAYTALTNLFADRAVAKEYLALVRGVPELRSGTINEPIGRNPIIRVKMAIATKTRGRPAITEWQVEEAFGKRAALVRCWPRTGRTHQIRVHLTHLGHPLLGDHIYGWKPRADDTAVPGRVMLHAALLSFAHPADGRLMEFRAPLPQDFSKLAAQLREETRRDAKA
jgi:23S rRNA pseudouridine1911/1915/1917 synthase